jgi:lipid-binding SYLF domain-containing protein
LSKEEEMQKYFRLIVGSLILFMVIVSAVYPEMAFADTAAEIDRDVNAALDKLYSREPAAKALAAQAKGILVFPSIVKGGLIIGGQYGEGALRVKGKTAGYYSNVAASYGLQAGVQKFGYALFFMTDSALKYLENSEGWEIGVGPSVVIVDEGIAKSLTTTTAKSDIYAFFFDQKGLMAGIGLQGTKITKINKY